MRDFHGSATIFGVYLWLLSHQLSPRMKSELSTSFSCFDYELFFLYIWDFLHFKIIRRREDSASFISSLHDAHTLGLITSWFHVQNNPIWDFFTIFTLLVFFFIHFTLFFLFFLASIFFSNFTSLKFQHEFSPNSEQLWSSFPDFLLRCDAIRKFFTVSTNFSSSFHFYFTENVIVESRLQNFEFRLNISGLVWCEIEAVEPIQLCQSVKTAFATLS